MTRKTSMAALFGSMQKRLVTELESGRVNAHPTTSGSAAEVAWRELLASHLPQRYRVDTAHVMDCEGRHSEQINIVIYDAHFTPRLSDYKGVVWVPAESVYAVLEVKPTLQGQIVYAGKKAASVRRLNRTSTCITYAAGEYPAKEPGPILAGIVADSLGWQTSARQRLTHVIGGLGADQRLNFGCSADGIAFASGLGPPGDLELVEGDGSLVHSLRTATNPYCRLIRAPELSQDDLGYSQWCSSRAPRGLADRVSLEPALLGETPARDRRRLASSDSCRAMLPALRETGTCRVSARCQSTTAEEVSL
jgi:hypothetical protein